MEAKVISETINPTPISTAKVLFALNSAGRTNPNNTASSNTAKIVNIIVLVTGTRVPVED